MHRINWNNPRISDDALKEDTQGLTKTAAETTAPLLATVPTAEKLLGISRTKVFDLLNQGMLERRKIGRATRITMRSIQRLAGV